MDIKMKHSMTKSTIILILIALIIGIIIGFSYDRNNDKNNDVDYSNEIDTIQQGSYFNVYPEIDQYILLSVENDQFQLYEQSILINQGTIESCGDNTFLLRGNCFDVDLYYVNSSDLWVCSFPNQKNYKQIELKYSTNVIITYGSEQ